MARIAGVNIPDNKHTVISLTYVLVLGVLPRAENLCEKWELQILH